MVDRRWDAKLYGELTQRDRDRVDQLGFIPTHIQNAKDTSGRTTSDNDKKDGGGTSNSRLGHVVSPVLNAKPVLFNRQLFCSGYPRGARRRRRAPRPGRGGRSRGWPRR